MFVLIQNTKGFTTMYLKLCLPLVKICYNIRMILMNWHMIFTTLAIVFFEYSAHKFQNWFCFFSWAVIDNAALKCDFNENKLIEIFQQQKKTQISTSRKINDI